MTFTEHNFVTSVLALPGDLGVPPSTARHDCYHQASVIGVLIFLLKTSRGGAGA